MLRRPSWSGFWIKVARGKDLKLSSTTGLNVTMSFMRRGLHCHQIPDQLNTLFTVTRSTEDVLVEQHLVLAPQQFSVVAGDNCSRLWFWRESGSSINWRDSGEGDLYCTCTVKLFTSLIRLENRNINAVHIPSIYD